MENLEKRFIELGEDMPQKELSVPFVDVYLSK